MTITHTWVTRGHCGACGQYSWTNPGSVNVTCRCGASRIENDVLVTGEAVTDEAVFRAAVCADIQVSDADLELVQG